MLHEVTRKIDDRDSLELWVRAGGRCEFRGCNDLLYKSPVTQERVNRAQRAHIWSFSPKGTRGRGPYARNTTGLNRTKNLLLVCHGCHQVIDQRGSENRYPPDLLQQWKHDHETRIVRVTGVSPKHKSHVVLYGSRIGEEDSPLQPDDAMEAIFPHRYPAEDVPINLSTKLEHNDGTPAFWATEAEHLRQSFERQLTRAITESRATHFSVFGFADMPLLVLLGSLFTDKRAVDVYQLLREPKGWRWQDDVPADFKFHLKRSRQNVGTPALVLSLSGRIDLSQVRTVLGDAAIWELSVADQHNDFLRSTTQLAAFRIAVRKAISAIRHTYPGKPLHIFPAMPVACAIEFGRARMPKPDEPWIIYDFDRNQKKFNRALTIGERHDPAK